MAQCDFLNLATPRYFVRNFTKEAVPQALLAQILQAGHLAPSPVTPTPTNFGAGQQAIPCKAAAMHPLPL